ncbi:hypothetical protein AFK24_12505 [Pseudomonas syringae]|uniref:DUF1795 domain-containing protein n=1 Tax=Pseudomonas syringae TaxID=317 RepID=A0A1C7Z6S2_PSESX|nr:hypothetical protein [Pseudomonas syringae]OCR24647.1 hypothetical protein AFK24_12505 [Pseudomonas syringae]
MKYLIGAVLALCCSASSFASVCEYSSPETISLTYHPGAFLPVYFSSYQLDLPGVPVALLSAEGFIAAYPDNGYIGVQHLNPAQMADSLPRLAKDLTSVADFYRLIYGMSAVRENGIDPQELSLQRSLLKLDCKSDVVFFQRDEIQIIFHGAVDSAGFHKIVLMDGDNVELITARGSRAVALKIVGSIKRRL